MSEAPRILPPKGEDSVPVFLLSGHSVRVYRVDPVDGKPGSDIPPKYRKPAIAAGCIYVGEQYEGDDEAEDQSNDALILAAIEAIVERDIADDLDASGRPTLKAVKAQAGFNVTRAQVDTAWQRFQESLA
jgi:hypothetical protein